MLTFTHSIGPDVRIRFSAKPDERIRDMLKANGFPWSPSAGLWWRRRISGAADFLAALDRALNPGRPDGACWVASPLMGSFAPRARQRPCAAMPAKPRLSPSAAFTALEVRPYGQPETRNDQAPGG